jgi:two-component system chemotaxis response regulator CheB
MNPRFRAVVVGVSTGGVDALKRLLPALPAAFGLPVLIVIHIAPGSSDGLARLLDGQTKIRVKEADEGELAVPGVAYLAPANYHLLVEPDGRLGLSTDQPVNCARPSVDVLFESAALCYGAGLIGVILTGAGSDGAPGLACVARLGGFTIVQEPGDAQMDSMPSAALAASDANRVVTLDALAALLIELAGREAP